MDADRARGVVDKAAPYVAQGYQLLHACVDTIYAIVQIVAAWKDEP